MKRGWLGDKRWEWGRQAAYVEQIQIRTKREGRELGSSLWDTLTHAKRRLKCSSSAFLTSSLWDCKEKSPYFCICFFYTSIWRFLLDLLYGNVVAIGKLSCDKNFEF